MRRSIAALIGVLTVSVFAALPAGAGRSMGGSFVARALPFSELQADIYYLQKGSCLGGIDGVHKVSKPFQALAAGELSVHIEGLSGDWDVYILGTRGETLGASEKAQILDGAEGEERITVAVKRHQRVQMVACNWLGEPEITVHFDFATKETDSGRAARHRSTSANGRGDKPATHKVEATGGPITPLWEWDPSELEILAGEKGVWLNQTGVTHHVTPYGGPWKNVGTMHLPTDDQVDFVFPKAGQYLYRCDFAFAGVEHSLLVGDECIGMCGRIVVRKRR
jgi:plastocyanin